MNEVITPKDTWLVVADSEKALFMKNMGDAQTPDFQVVRAVVQDNPSTSDQGTDKPGRFNDGPSVQRSGVQQTDWHELEKTRFAEDLAERLLALVRHHDAKRLVLAAAPSVLGDVRRVMHADVRNAIIAEVPKTLTNHPTEEAVRLALRG